MDTAPGINAVTELFAPIFKRYDVRKAVLFGSVAKGTNRENSDLDIVVDSDLKGLSFVGLLEDLQQAVNIEVDLFDVTHIRKDSPVDNEIRETGVVIYEG